jgi:hypothetical protein
VCFASCASPCGAPGVENGQAVSWPTEKGRTASPTPALSAGAPRGSPGATTKSERGLGVPVCLDQATPRPLVQRTPGKEGFVAPVGSLTFQIAIAGCDAISLDRVRPQAEQVEVIARVSAQARSP